MRMFQNRNAFLYISCIRKGLCIVFLQVDLIKHKKILNLHHHVAAWCTELKKKHVHFSKQDKIFKKIMYKTQEKKSSKNSNC